MLKVTPSSTYLVYTDVAFITEHHVIPLFTIRGAADITDDVLIVLYTQPFHRLDGVVHVVMALPLKGLQGSLHCQLIQRPLPWERTRGKNPHSENGYSRD